MSSPFHYQRQPYRADRADGSAHPTLGSVASQTKNDPQPLPVLLACSHPRYTAHGISGCLKMHQTQSPTTTADWHDPAAKWACACLKLVFSKVCGARPNPLHDISARASCDSLQSPLWQAGFPNDDIQTDAVHSPVHAAAFAERHRLVPAFGTKRQTYAGQPIHTPDALTGHADPSHHARLVASRQASVASQALTRTSGFRSAPLWQDP